MPRRAPKRGPAEDAIYTAWQSFAVADMPQIVARGTRLLGSHPIVQNHFHFFVLDASSGDELQSKLAKLYPQFPPDQAHVPVTPPAPPPLEASRSSADTQ